MSGASFGSGFAGGFGGGYSVGAGIADMGMKAQALEEARMQKFLGGIQLFQKDPGAGEVYLKELMPTIGVDENRQKFILEALKKGNTEQITAFQKMAGDAIASGIPTKSILNTPFHEWPNLIKNLGDMAERKAVDEAALKFPMGGGQPAEPSFAQGRGSQVPAPTGSAIPAPSGSMVPPANPVAVQPGSAGAPSSAEGPVAAVTPNRGQVSIAGVPVNLDQGQGIKALEAADRFKVMQERANFLESQGHAGAADKIRQSAEREKMNAHITLTPAQARRVGFKPGAIVQVNAADGTLKQVQEGHDTFSLVQDPNILKMFKPGAVVMRSGLTGDLMVKQQGQDRFAMVNPADYGLPPDAVVQKNQTDNKIDILTQGGERTRPMTPEEIKAQNLDPNTPWYVDTKGRPTTPDKLTTERAVTADLSKQDIETLGNTRKAIAAGKNMIATAGVIKKLAPGASGALAGAKITASRIFDALGMKDEAAKTRGAEATALRGFLNQSVEALASSLDGKVSGKTLNFLRQAQGSIYDTAEGLEILADALEQGGNDLLEANDIAEKHFRSNKNSLSAADDTGDNYYDKMRKRPGRTLTPEMEEKMAIQEADLSIKDLGIKGVTSDRISKSSVGELGAILEFGRQGKLSEAQKKIARDRYEALSEKEKEQFNKRYGVK